MAGCVRLSAVILVATVLFSIKAAPDRYHPWHPHHDPPPAPNDWIARGQEELAAALSAIPKWKSAKNVILFLGDGMGISTLTPARIYKAQKAGQPIPDAKLSWEDMPWTGYIKTYTTDYQTPDSGATATAIVSGVKTGLAVIGVDENVPRGDCTWAEEHEVPSIAKWAQDEGLWTGVISTSRITHASPAALYAHTSQRGWENDANVVAEGCDPDETWDIAKQLIDKEENQNIRVLLGGGRREMVPKSTPDPEDPSEYGKRADGRNLIDDWLNVRSEMGIGQESYKYVQDKAGFDAVDPNTVDYLLGLFAHSHMKFEADRQDDAFGEPSLAEMVKKSLDILKKGPDGYVLFAEGARIDHAHHGNNAYKALEDTLALEEAVKVAMDETSAEDTLIIVTADHSHPLSMSGYQPLDTDILGVAGVADDALPYLTLSYASGPGYYARRNADGSRLDLTGVDTTGKDFRQDSAVPKGSATHAGEDVAVYARGPMAHLFSGQHEQSYIAHAAMYAACIGWNKDLCGNPPPFPGGNPPPNK